MSSIIPETPSIKAAVIHINSIDNSKFTRLLSRILHKLHLKEERSFSEEEEEKLQSALSLERQTLQLLLESVSFILEQAVYHNVKPASLRQHLENISVESEKAEIFSQLWASAGADVLEKIRHRIFAPKKLDHVGWQLSLQMARSDQSRLKAPHAVLNLGLRAEDDSERLQDVFLEFSHQDLLDFYNQMETVQTQLDSLTSAGKLVNRWRDHKTPAEHTVLEDEIHTLQSYTTTHNTLTLTYIIRKYVYSEAKDKCCQFT